MSETKVLQLASCTMSKKEYIQDLKDIGKIPSGPATWMIDAYALRRSNSGSLAMFAAILTGC